MRPIFLVLCTLLALLPAVLAAQKPTLTIPLGHAQGARLSDFSQDGTRLVTGGLDGAIILWDLGTRRQLRTIYTASQMDRLCLGPDGASTLIVSSAGASIWSFVTGTKTLSITSPGGGGDMLQDARFSESGLEVAAICADGTAAVFDSTTGSMKWHEPLDVSSVRREACSIAISPNGSLLATIYSRGRGEQTLYIWDRITSQCKLRKSLGGRNPIFPDTIIPLTLQSEFLGSENRLLIYGKRFTPIIIDLDNKSADFTLTEGNSVLWDSVRYTPHGNLLLTSYSANPWFWKTASETKNAHDKLDGTYIRDASTGKTIRKLPYLYNAVWSHDGKRISGMTSLSETSVFNVSGKREFVLESRTTRYLERVSFATEQHFIMTSIDRRLQVIDNFDRLNTWFYDFDYGIDASACAPKKHTAVLGLSDNSVHVINLLTRKEIARVEGRELGGNMFSTDIKEIEVSEDAETISIVTSTSTESKTKVRKAQIWRQAKITFSVECAASAMSPDGKYLAIVRDAKTKAIELIALDSGKVSRRFPAYTDQDFQAHYLEFEKSETESVKSGKRVSGTGYASLPENDFMELSFGASDKLIVRTDNALVVHALPLERVIGIIYTATSRASFHASDNGKMAVLFHRKDPTHSLSSMNSSMEIIDLETRKAIWVLGPPRLALYGDPNSICSAELSSDGNLVAALHWDGVVRIYDIKEQKELIALAADGSNCAGTLSDGRFDSTLDFMKRLYWVLPESLETLELDQIKGRYWRPGLLAKILQRKDVAEPLGFPLEEMPPKVVLNGQPRNDIARYSISGGSGGIGDVRVFVGGTAVPAQSVKLSRAGGGGSAELEVDLAEVIARGVTQTLRVQAFNKAGSLFSLQQDSWEEPGTAADPTLHVIAVGIAAYSGSGLAPLVVPPKDAADFARAMGLGGNRLFKGRVRTTVLSSSPGLVNLAGARVGAPTKANIREAFRDLLAAAQPQDTVLVFFAGHGVTYSDANGEHNYCYLLQDAPSAEMSDEKVRGAFGITTDDLKAWILPGSSGAGLRAQKRMLILDTCASSAVIEGFAERGDEEATKTQELFKDSTGFWILAGSSKEASSYEAFGQGMLTYGILLGLQKDGLVGDRAMVKPLLDYVEVTVPKIVSARFGFVQQPKVFRPGSDDFPLGILETSDREKIKPRNIGMWLLKPDKIGDADRNALDHLGLTELLANELRIKNEDSILSGRGDTWFMPVETMIDGFVPFGSYRVDGDKVTVRLSLRKGLAALPSANATVTGSVSNPKKLAKDMADKLFELGASVSGSGSE